jgi:small ligand-binding sensory domain FIST
MPFAAALSTLEDSDRALEEVCRPALAGLGGAPDLALLFYSPGYVSGARELAAAAQRRLGARCLLGCPGQGIIANEREVEEEQALGLWVARWPQRVELSPFHVTLAYTPDGASLLGWPDELTGADPATAVLLVLADPYTFPIDDFLEQVNDSHPGLRVVGGMASGTRGPGSCRLLNGERVADEGAVGVLLQGPVKVRTVVSQGCRPIGKHLVVTRARDNVITELGGKSPWVQLQEMWPGLPARDQDLIRQGMLHVGRVINEYQGEFQRGDFLVRNVMSLDRQTGALAITDKVRVGQTVQFHVRDAETADEDLHALLQLDVSAHERPPTGALVFSCNGRGTRLFTEPHHDAGVIRAEAGAVPLAGFFAQGELGPVGGQNFIHGFTASVVLFED